MEDKIKVEKNLNESIIEIRVKLQNAKLKKSGKNKFAGFDYFELADFLPKLNELMLEEKINDRFYIKDGYAILEIQKGNEIATYQMPFVLFETPLTFKKDKNGNFLKDKNGEYIQVASMQDIQYLGALNTYYKRYLYINAFGITDGEIIDSMNNDDLQQDKASEAQIEYIKKLVEDIPSLLTYYKIEKLEDLSKKDATDVIKRKTKKWFYVKKL